MPQKHDDINQFGVQDIERYYNGQMTPHEMHLLEKAALDDPFLAEALEGYVHTQTPVQDVAYLREQLAEKADRKSAPIIWWNRGLLRIAAIVIVMAISGVLIYQLSKIGVNDIAKNAPEATPKQTVDTVNNGINKDTTTAVETTAIAPVTTHIPKLIKQKVYKKEVKARVATQQELLAKAVMQNDIENAARMADSNQKAAENLASFRTKAVAMPPPAEQLQGKVAGISVEKEFKGKVVDNKNNPVPFAIVSVKGTKNATQADSVGNFTITGADTALNVAINSVGYDGYNGILKSGDANNIVTLNTSSQSLSEVVVTAHGVNSNHEEESPPPIVVLKNAKPIDGRQDFNNYIESEINKLKAGGFLEKGKVKLVFEIDADGNAINITTDKATCKSCTEKAVHILESAPALKLKNNRKKAKATIYF